MSVRLEIESMGARGDGVARHSGQSVHVPFSLPGEIVNVSVNKDRGEIVSLLETSPQRVEPPCRHFGRCGGCALQHWDIDAYRAWKRGKVISVLAGAGIDAPVKQLVACAPASRRRAVFALRRTEAGMLLGYNEAHSHNIVDLEECHVVLPAIASKLSALRRAATAVCATGKPFKLTVIATRSGLDLAFSDTGPMSDKARHAIVKLALDEGFARVSIDGETVIEPDKPIVMADDVAVAIVPGAFMQAVAEAEKAMVELALGHLRKQKRVADLFSGWGAFSLRLARQSIVHAVESDALTLASLDDAYRHAKGLKTLTSEKRDLFRRPLTFKELNRFDAVLFDPPRAGAEAQTSQLARSNVRKVVAVSCNPVTLARDLAILRNGGYAVISVTPIDQFVWSPHVEAVALLEKKK